MKRFAVIGAGIAGLTVARSLMKFGSVTIFEKSRGLGGRLATRYTDTYQFDHGVQFFTAKTEAFQTFLKPLEMNGTISRWDAEFVELDQGQVVARRQWDDELPHYVASPKMNALGKFLANGLDVRRQTLVTGLSARDGHWLLFGENDETLGDYDWVISTIPAAQAAQILPATFKHFERLATTQMLGCHALMVGIKTPLALDWQAALVKNSSLSWISIDSSKPGRPDGFSIVAHAANAWSQDHIEEDNDSVRSTLLAELSGILNTDLSDPDFVSVHRWRYANIGKQTGESALIDPEAKLAACGDWCIRGRVEEAFSSAHYLSKQLEHLIC